MSVQGNGTEKIILLPANVSAWIFIKLALLATGLILTNHFISERLGYFLEYGLYFALFVFTGIWICALAALVYIAFTPRIIERYFWAILIGLATWLAEAHFQITGVRITIQALDAMWDPGLIRLESLGFFGSYFLQALLYTIPLMLAFAIAAFGAFPVPREYAVTLCTLPSAWRPGLLRGLFGWIRDPRYAQPVSEPWSVPGFCLQRRATPGEVRSESAIGWRGACQKHRADC